MFQRVFLSAISKLALFLMQISGLWPFSYDRGAKKFKFLWYFTITPVVIIGYPFVVAMFWSKRVSREIVVKNTFVLLLSFTFLIFNSVNFVILFVSHYCKFKQIKILILRTCEVIAELNVEFDTSEYRYGKYLVKFIVKTVFLLSVLIYSMFQSMERFTKFNGDYLLYLMSALPNIIMKFQPDLFFTGLLITEFYLSRINDKVLRVMTSAKHLSETNSDLDEQKRYQKMIDFCRLSDVLDRLCVLQCSVVEVCENFVRLFSFQITMWMALGLMVFLVNMFQEYMSITTSFRGQEFSLAVFVNDLLSVALVIAEMYMTSAASDSVMIEVGFVVFSFLLKQTHRLLGCMLNNPTTKFVGYLAPNSRNKILCNLHTSTLKTKVRQHFFELIVSRPPKYLH